MAALSPCTVRSRTMTVVPPSRGPLGKINGFQLLKFLGKGTFGAVYQARREADGKIYAIKKVDTRKMTAKERAEAVNEIRVLASVAGEHVITFYEAFVEQDILYIVTEFAGQSDLLQLLKTKRRAGHLPEATVWSFFIQMCLGVKTMHDNNILHRDLKAANVFMCSSSYLKLGDLGVAKVLKHDQALASTQVRDYAPPTPLARACMLLLAQPARPSPSSSPHHLSPLHPLAPPPSSPLRSRSTATRVQVGTPYYVAPEVWRNKPYNSKCDMWSLGCLLYELCTYRPPFEAESMEGLARKVMKGRYEPIPNFYSQALRTTLSKLLVVEPNYRSSVNDILSTEPVCDSPRVAWRGRCRLRSARLCPMALLRCCLTLGCPHVFSRLAISRITRSPISRAPSLCMRRCAFADSLQAWRPLRADLVPE